MGDLLPVLFVLLIVLTIITVGGHVIWVIVREILKWLFDVGSKDQPPDELKDLAATERQIIRLYTDGKINDEIFEQILARIRDEVTVITSPPRPKPRPQPQPSPTPRIFEPKPEPEPGPISEPIKPIEPPPPPPPPPPLPRRSFSEVLNSF